MPATHHSDLCPLVLLTPHEQRLRIDKVRERLAAGGLTHALVTGNANKFYLTGRVFTGYILITPSDTTYYVRRPVELSGTNVVYMRKPEELGLTLPELALELDELPYSTTIRLCKAFATTRTHNLSPLLMAARAVKTAAEIALLEESGRRQDEVYGKIPSLFRPGMTDLEFQIEIERASRLAGCIGQFRISGDSMELFMGNVLAGDNADSPSPYDFAMGGAGMNPSIPVGADGTTMKPGMTVMVDVNGNYTGYMTDMTRDFRIGQVAEQAVRAHECSVEIHRRLSALGTPGTPASRLWEEAAETARSYHLEDYFMGHRQHAGFVGHGVGIEINELPVIAPRSKHLLEENNVIALEPKFVIPGTGAAGIENTYVVTPAGLRRITNCTEQFIDLESRE